MAPFDRTRALRWFALFVALLLLLAVPWPGLRESWSRGYSAALNGLLLDHLTFGAGGHARLRPPRPDERRIESHVVTDTILSLRVDGHSGELPVGMSLRRDTYLPIALLLAVLLSAPLPRPRKLRALAIGVPVIAALTVACQWLGVVWLFSKHLRGVLDLAPAHKALLDTGFAALLLPPANRFVVPLLLGPRPGLVWWQRRVAGVANSLPERPSSPLTAPDTVPASQPTP